MAIEDRLTNRQVYLLTEINYDNKTFASVQNSETGEASSESIFHYHQKDGLVWAEYKGGAIFFGTLIAKCDDEENLEKCYQHLNTNDDLMTENACQRRKFSPMGESVCTKSGSGRAAIFSEGKLTIEEPIADS